MVGKSNVALAVDHINPITIPSYNISNNFYADLLDIYTSASERKMNFVIDIESPYSFIKLNCLRSDTQVSFRNTIDIRRIANKAIEKTLGTIDPLIGFRPTQVNISAKLHILPKYQFPYDGIFGRDLLNALDAHIYIKDRKVKFNTLNLIVSFSDQSAQRLLPNAEESQPSKLQNQNKRDEPNIANTSISIPYELDNHKNHDTPRSAKAHKIKILTKESTITFLPNSNLITEIDNLNRPYNQTISCRTKQLLKQIHAPKFLNNPKSQERKRCVSNKNASQFQLTKFQPQPEPFSIHNENNLDLKEATTASGDESRTDTVVIYCITHNFSPHKEYYNS